LQLSEALLRRLANERYNRTKSDRKVMSYCMIVILEGGEDWPENEFADYLKEINAAEELAASKVEEQKKAWAQEKEKWKKAREDRINHEKK
jgi:23S rRNA pseudoU1915 N3-methylase RlmH